MDSILGSVFGPQNGGRFVGKIVVTERKKAQVSIVSSCTRQKFPIPRVSRALQRREYLFSTPCEHLWPHMFLNCSRTCVGINVRRAWRTIARGAAKPWEPSGAAVCETSVAYLRKQSKLALFFDRRQKICRQTAPVWGSRNGPQNGGQVVRTQANQIETE